ncbi:beta-N-acetylhexosaminidase [Polycyclovorans algicola]|uniref:beta-N-acetylhexosaminidase n=1 Tax=Polycyclovorans algicola TaxID=616992 RepID=UPI0004A6B2A0|nr:beta-N-acetylhexosaminidase [Polycyclovorans algicola]
MNKPSLIGPLMLDVGGLEVTAEDREVLSHPLVGGVILFTRNYRDAVQLKALCDDLLAIKTPRLLLAVDHEGGRIQRFRVGFSRLPAMRSIGERLRESVANAEAEAEQVGNTIGTELAAFGIDLPFAPVLDIDHGVSGVIGDRAFGSDVQTVIQLARAFRRGLNRAGLSATGKHYPGHGAVTADSHHELPVDRRPLADIERGELQPFEALIRDGLESIMTAHVRYTAVDDTPASLSAHWVKTVLRKQLGFQGVVFTDDLSMGGAAAVGSMEDRARMALDAGSDMLLVCNDRPASIALLDALRDVRPRPTASVRLHNLYRREPA